MRAIRFFFTAIFALPTHISTHTAMSFPPKKNKPRPPFSKEQPGGDGGAKSGGKRPFRPKRDDRKPERAEENAELQLVFGRHPVLEALQAGVFFEKILFQQGLRGEFEKEVRHACRDAEVALQVVPKERLDAMVRGGNHQGVVGLRSPIEYRDLESVLDQVEQRGERPLLLLLDGVTDVRNLGAIARSAEVAGAQALVLPLRGVAAINEEALKTSAGALHRLPVCRVKNLQVALDLLSKRGIRSLAADMRAPTPLSRIDFSQPSAILLGAEGRGIAPELLKKVSQTFSIPMRGSTGSFNVSVAAGIVLYEAIRGDV